MTLHLKKLCVGANSVDDLITWQRERSFEGPGGLPVVRHVTRNRPCRADELLDGGSLYWIIKGVILARNPILALEHIEDDQGKTRCGIILKAGPVFTRPRRHRPFQGWRYYDGEAAPADFHGSLVDGHSLPAELTAELEGLGLI